MIIVDKCPSIIEVDEEVYRFREGSSEKNKEDEQNDYEPKKRRERRNEWDGAPRRR